MKVGVLALQGGFSLHQQRLTDLGRESRRVATIADMQKIDGLILPGGESSTFLKLCDEEFRTEISRRISEGLPVLATCAGLILLAKHVAKPEQQSLGLIDVDVERNAYGRQMDSFIAPSLKWTAAGEKLLSGISQSPSPVEGVFIRAPRITKVGDQAEVIIEHSLADGTVEPVLVRQGNRFGATFHPELSPHEDIVHRLFLAAI